MIKQSVGAVIPIQDKFLVQERVDGLWLFPGGKIEENEDPLDAIIRECKEEINIDIIHARSILEDYKDSQEFLVTLYYVDDWRGTLKNLEPHKCINLHLLTLDEVAEKVGIDMCMYSLLIRHAAP